MTRHYILRHGNTFDPGDTLLRIGARTDIPLSKSGWSQAQQLADWLRDELHGETPDLIVGPLLRTRQTGEVIANAFDTSLSIRIDPNLREVDYGPDEGRPESEVRARIGINAFERWEREAIVPDGWQVDACALTEVWKTALNRPVDNTQIYVTSNGVARFALAALGERPRKLRTGSAGLIEFTNRAPVLKFWDQRPDNIA